MVVSTLIRGGHARGGPTFNDSLVDLVRRSKPLRAPSLVLQSRGLSRESSTPKHTTRCRHPSRDGLRQLEKQQQEAARMIRPRTVDVASRPPASSMLNGEPTLEQRIKMQNKRASQLESRDLPPRYRRIFSHCSSSGAGDGRKESRTVKKLLEAVSTWGTLATTGDGRGGGGGVVVAVAEPPASAADVAAESLRLEAERLRAAEISGAEEFMRFESAADDAVH